jgi:hypothetical protein
MPEPPGLVPKKKYKYLINGLWRNTATVSCDGDTDLPIVELRATYPNARVWYLRDRVDRFPVSTARVCRNRLALAESDTCEMTFGGRNACFRLYALGICTSNPSACT